MSDQSRIRTAILISLLLHGSLLWMWAAYRVAQEILRQSRPVDIDMISMPPQPPPPPAAPRAAPRAPAVAEPVVPPPPQAQLFQKQIVAPSDSGEEKPPSETRLLSDRDNTVAKESVQVGDGAKKQDNPPPKPAAEPAPKPQAEARRPLPEPRAAPPAHPRERADAESLPKLDQLLPQAGDLAMAGSSAPSRDSDSASAPNNDARRKLALPQTEAFSARPGTRDFLPSIRQSDITMLNTKADRFAPFVRRVAQRVFQHLEIQLRQASNQGATSGKEFAVVEAVMNKQGRLIGARIVDRDSTSSLSADRVLLSATAPDIFFDENPPSGAEASDGNIHFKLMIDLEVVAYDDPRSGRGRAGYHGMAGVGLD